MRLFILGILLCALCCLAGCETTPRGDLDPVRTLKVWDRWVQDNMW